MYARLGGQGSGTSNQATLATFQNLPKRPSQTRRGSFQGLQQVNAGIRDALFGDL